MHMSGKNTAHLDCKLSLYVDQESVAVWVEAAAKGHGRCAQGPIHHHHETGMRSLPKEKEEDGKDGSRVVARRGGMYRSKAYAPKS